MKKKGLAGLLLAGMCLIVGCGSTGDYDGYSAAFNKIKANAGVEANFDVNLTIDGDSVASKGNLKLDTSGDATKLYYEMDVDGSKITQFMDGKYIYTDSNGQKTKYAIDAKPEAAADSTEAEKKNSSDVIVCSVERDNKTIIPNGRFIIKTGDKLNIIGLSKNLRQFLKKAKLITGKTKNVIIFIKGSSFFCF